MPDGSAQARGSGSGHRGVSWGRGAALRVNGLDLGTLPLGGPLTLGPGTYLVESELQGFRA
ncbi:MAG: hypothetical protein IH621_13920, partial [Krumholzibacteria bacterium]|nr:hypothetical protein [Candidatus Krumholzibacteria bacterium]